MHLITKKWLKSTKGLTFSFIRTIRAVYDRVAITSETGNFVNVEYLRPSGNSVDIKREVIPKNEIVKQINYAD